MIQFENDFLADVQTDGDTVLITGSRPHRRTLASLLDLKVLWGCLILTACRAPSQRSSWISFFSPRNLIFETVCGLKKHRNSFYADIISLYCYHWWWSDMWLSLIHALQINKGALIFAVRRLLLGFPLHERGQCLCICTLYLLTAACTDQAWR